MSQVPLAEVYFGTYTKPGKSEGIYQSVLNLESGHMSEPRLAAKTYNPSFILIHPGGKFLYATGEEKNGVVKAYAINPDGKPLTFLNGQSSGGAHPCHLTIDSTGTYLFVANYSGGNFSIIPINPDGTLAPPQAVIKHDGSSINLKRQTSPHPHSVNFSPDGRFLFVADLGLDKIKVYRFNNKTGDLIPEKDADVEIHPGSGPRHFTFHTGSKFAYVINELDNTINVFSYTVETGKLKAVQTVSALPEGFNGISWCAEIKVSSDGKFLYGSNRGHDSIVVFKVDAKTGTLSSARFQNTGIKNPRHFNFDGGGVYCLVASQDGDNIRVFRIDAQTGSLKDTTTTLSIGNPVCVQFLQP
jgi:6-phosphogluconolactonase